MQRVVILGPGGAGKSELARRIAARTGLPVTHLDVLFYRENWTPAPRADAVAQVAAVAATDRWIIDGNFLDGSFLDGNFVDGSGADGRFARADTVIFLDLPRRICIRRVIHRFLRDRRRDRPDLPVGSREGFDPEGLRWIWHYRRRNRPQVVRLLAAVPACTRVHHLRSPAQVRRYLRTVC